MKSKHFVIKSAGAAYNLNLGFVPDRMEVVNRTAWATDARKVEHKYFRGMAAAYDLSEVCADTEANRAIETSNGFTWVPSDHFLSNKKTISAATAASPCVVTVTSHGWGAAGVILTVRIHDIVGMTQLNNNLYRATIIDANSVSLQDLNGIDLDSSGYTAYSSGGSMYNVGALTNDTGGYMTLGSTVMGSNGDVLDVVAFIDDIYINIGQV
jgi:hypothetical protein